ncbi:MAG: hydrolase, partial [Pseudarthrobacter sp.]|nr:hydrolase [Pseudarthrobacter sp.]
MKNRIVVSAVCVFDDLGRLLTVRKRGTSMFMHPGGKPEAGEAAVQ